MDLDKIFLEGACPTSIGGQAVMEGIMMRGPKKVALAVRTGDNEIRLKTKYGPRKSGWMKVPILRGIVAFWQSLVEGTRTLMDSATILEEAGLMEDENKEDRAECYGKTGEINTEIESGTFSERIEARLRVKYGDKAAWNVMIYFSVIVAVIFSIGVFVLLPTWVIGLFKGIIHNSVALSFTEGIFRLIIFLAYIVAISYLDDIRRVFQYHGAEHKTIHCFEKGMDLTAENAQSFYRLHPRCGTSFLVFVMIITLLVFPLMGWPDLWERLLSRIVLIPVIAGLSYEVLKWAGMSNSILVKTLSLPGIYLQKITTREPDKSMLEVAIVAMKAVLPEENDTPLFDGIVDNNGSFLCVSEKGSGEAEENKASECKVGDYNRGDQNDNAC
ncbi:MAG: DUF1385 domain-containing protein [Clostridiales bacterium]|nr:DUF1385 domain-containing protein [Clostridiales bacterium]MDY4061060.1 DUF1385 domain-containing protein [Anaerovoracaceae bacterium]